MTQLSTLIQSGGASTSPTFTGVTTLTGGAVIQGLTVGLGANAVANNTALGVNALSNASLSGSYNVGVGSNVLSSNTTGIYNTGVGVNALGTNTTANNNTAVGLNALTYNTGGNNTAVGMAALQANLGGANNIGIGQGAGNALTTGSNNTIIGSVPGTAGLADTVIIAAGAVERMRIDSSGNVGIGATPITGYKMALGSSTNTARIVQNQTAIQADASAYVVGGIDLNDVIRDSIGSYPAAYMRYINKNTNGSFPTTVRGIDITFGTADGATAQGTTAVERMRIDSSGNVGIGTSTPNTPLNVSKTFSTDTTLLTLSQLSNSAAKTNIDFTVNGNTTVVGRIASDYIQSLGKGELAFSTYGSGVLTERMRIDSSGVISYTGSLTVSAYTETIVASGTVGASATLAITAGTLLTATLTSATACTITLPPVSPAGKSFTLMLKQPAAGTATTATFITNPVSHIMWNSSGAPIITATLGKMDILTFVSDGTNWYGSYSQGYTY